MRIVALLSWYDEEPVELVRYVAGLERLRCRALVAYDGAYERFPKALPYSPLAQTQALVAACRRYGVALHLHQPVTSWANNEIGKRSAMHACADALYGEPGDWHIVLDADEVPDQVPDDLDTQLDRATEPVGLVTLLESGGAGDPRHRLFRGGLGTHLRKTHYLYYDGDGTQIVDSKGLVPAARVLDLVVSHRGRQRPVDREKAKRLYYELRLEDTLEAVLLCERCGGEASQRVRVAWRLLDGVIMSDPMDACQWCAEAQRQASRLTLAGMGHNPDRLAL